MVLNSHTHTIREDLTFKNRNYQVIVYPGSVTNPEPRMTVFFWNPEGKKLFLRQVIGSLPFPTLPFPTEKLGLPWETEDDLLQEGRTLAEHHANNS